MDHHSPDASGPNEAPDDKNTTGGNEPSFDDLMTEVVELGEHAVDYAAVKVDAMRARLRGMALGIVVRVCGILVAVITISTLSLYTLRGIRGALEAVTGRAWLADLLTGTLGLGGAWAGLWLHEARAARIARDRMVLKHEHRKSKKHQLDRHSPDGSRATRPKRMTELDYLQEEADVAKENLQDSCKQVGRSIKATATQAWRKHPVMIGAAAAGLAGLGVVWFLHGRQRKTTRTYVTEVEASRSRSLLSRAGGLIGKMLFSLILTKLTTPPVDEASPSSEDLSGTEATA